ncbi:hypothetical protein [Streptomyces sp. ITFR-16]|uniref:hypothetical protein n=1 Tax=Streptomyces sp. ITFR-16 TaxID=3075198 RepID=UPI00288A0037|nr:hypothetical protein [Streptomyces sp. ITFR-16]WNI20841.1 hypothetical protein RLT58_02425 [Streptomyces sp. ITFR-16]
MSHPQRYEILLVPEYTEARGTGPGGSDAAGATESGASEPGAGGSSVKGSTARDSDGRGRGAAIRSAVVTATGDTGESGYPRYEGDGMVADIDPDTQTVEALLVDGSELGYGLSVRISRNTDG